LANSSVGGHFGLNRVLVGMFRFDLVAFWFGVMTPLARVVHVLLGLSAMYCVITTVTFVKRHTAQ
jgi:uncharacterized protein